MTPAILESQSHDSRPSGDSASVTGFMTPEPRRPRSVASLLQTTVPVATAGVLIDAIELTTRFIPIIQVATHCLNTVSTSVYVHTPFAVVIH